MSDDPRRPAVAPVRDDHPDERRIADALEDVRTVVAEHDRDHHLTEPIPAAVRGRIDETLDYLSRTTADQPGPPAFDSPPRGRRFRRGAVIGTVAAAAVAAIAVPVVIGVARDNSGASAGPSDQASAESTMDGPVDAALISGALGRSTEGPFADEAARAACLAENGVAAQTPILGSERVRIDDADGTLFVLPGAEPDQMVGLVVGDDCGAGNSDRIARSDIG